MKICILERISSESTLQFIFSIVFSNKKSKSDEYLLILSRNELSISKVSFFSLRCFSATLSTLSSSSYKAFIFFCETNPFFIFCISL